MAVFTGRIKSENNPPTTGMITEDTGPPAIPYDDPEYESKDLGVGNKVCYRKAIKPDGSFVATNLVKLVEDGETVLDGGVHGPQTVGSAAKPGELLRVINGAIINGDITVTKSAVIIEGASNVNGNIRATIQSGIAVQAGSKISGFINSHQGIDVVVENSEVTDDISLKANPSGKSQGFSISGSNIGGDIDVTKATEVEILNNVNTINGDISVTKSVSVKINDNKVEGEIGIYVKKVDSCEVCGNTLTAGELDVPAPCIEGC